VAASCSSPVQPAATGLGVLEQPATARARIGHNHFFFLRPRSRRSATSAELHERDNSGMKEPVSKLETKVLCF
jgi:hypothetical protein